MIRNGELVQILIPCLNGEEYLEETLISIQNQTYGCFDCLMVDDGSCDESSRIFNNIAQRDSRFRLITNEHNLGESYSVNRGWGNSKGDLICILSFDDPQPSDWLENMIKFRSENPGFIVYYPNRLVINKDGETIRSEVLFDWERSLLTDDLLCIVSVGAIIDTTFVPKDFEPRIQEVVFPSDLIQYLKLSEFGDGIRHPSYFSIWREHGRSKSAEGKKILAKEFAEGVHTYLKKNSGRDIQIQKSAIYANLVRMLQKDFSIFPAIVLASQIYLGEFEFRSLSVAELFKIFTRFRQRRITRQIKGL